MDTFPRVTHPCAALYCYSARLACVRPAASVRSEPGSNSQVDPKSSVERVVRLKRRYSTFRPMGGRNALLLLSRQRNASYNRAQSSVPGLVSGVAIEPPPASPFLKSQCQRAASRHEKLVCQRHNTARKTFTSQAAWARYIGGGRRPVKQEFADNS